MNYVYGVRFRCGVEEILKKSRPVRTAPPRILAKANVRFLGRTYLIFGFMGVEFAFGKFLKLDMKGFSQQQIASMHTYEKLLVELGEKTYVPGDSKWPVELRLLFTVVIQAAIFIFGKMMMKKTGTNVMSMMSNFTNQAQTSVKREKKKAFLQKFLEFELKIICCILW